MAWFAGCLGLSSLQFPTQAFWLFWRDFLQLWFFWSPWISNCDREWPLKDTPSFLNTLKCDLSDSNDLKGSVADSFLYVTDSSASLSTSWNQVQRHFWRRPGQRWCWIADSICLPFVSCLISQQAQIYLLQPPGANGAAGHVASAQPIQFQALLQSKSRGMVWVEGILKMVLFQCLFHGQRLLPSEPHPALSLTLPGMRGPEPPGHGTWSSAKGLLAWQIYLEQLPDLRSSVLFYMY